jgi:hypothetical protein
MEHLRSCSHSGQQRVQNLYKLSSLPPLAAAGLNIGNNARLSVCSRTQFLWLITTAVTSVDITDSLSRNQARVLDGDNISIVGVDTRNELAALDVDVGEAGCALVLSLAISA